MKLFQKAIKASELTTFDKAKLARIIDVRSNLEYKQGNVKGSKNVPLEQLVANPSVYIKDQAEYYIICQSGMRSKRAISLLRRQGYTNLTNIKGGYTTYARIQNN